MGSKKGNDMNDKQIETLSEKVSEYITVIVLLTVLQLAGLLTVGWLGTAAILAGYATGDILLTLGRRAYRRIRGRS